MTQAFSCLLVGVQVTVEEVKVRGMVGVELLKLCVSPADAASKRQPALLLRRSNTVVGKEKLFVP